MQENSIDRLNYYHKTIDFMRWDFVAFSASLMLLCLAVFIIFVRGFNWGLDFTGGTVMEIHLEKPAHTEWIRKKLEIAGFQDSIVQNFGSTHDVMIRLSKITCTEGKELSNKVIGVVNSEVDSQAVLKRIECVGPSVGRELGQNGAIALLAALISILIYVGLRFEWRLALGVVIALAHDLVITVGALSLSYIEIDLTIVASLMSVIGYSLNDSIVVSNRIYENFHKIHHGTPYDIINLSLTQTLTRTLMTSGATLLVVLILYIFGGEMLHGFSMTMFIGVSIGTISSIYVASALALKFGMKREHYCNEISK